MAANKEGSITVDNKMLLEAINKVNDQLSILAGVTTNDQKNIIRQLDLLIAKVNEPKPVRARAGAAGSTTPAAAATQKTKAIKNAPAFFINEYVTKEDVRSKYVAQLPEIHARKDYIKVNNADNSTAELKLRAEAKYLWEWMKNRADMTKDIELYTTQFETMRGAAKKALGHVPASDTAAPGASSSSSAAAPAAPAAPASSSAPASKKEKKGTAAPAAAKKQRAPVGKKKSTNAAPSLAETAVADNIDDSSDSDEVPAPTK